MIEKFIKSKFKLGSLFILAVSIFLLSGCNYVGVRNFSSVSCDRFSCDTEELHKNSAVVYVPKKNQASIVRIDDVDVNEGQMMTTLNTASWADTVYVKPGRRVVELVATWGNTLHRAALPINVQKGHAYRIIFDKPSVSFKYEDMGKNMEPDDLVKPSDQF